LTNVMSSANGDMSAHRVSNFRGLDVVSLQKGTSLMSHLLSTLFRSQFRVLFLAGVLLFMSMPFDARATSLHWDFQSGSRLNFLKLTASVGGRFYCSAQSGPSILELRR
jgi:hypothetical protein